VARKRRKKNPESPLDRVLGGFLGALDVQRQELEDHVVEELTGLAGNLLGSLGGHVRQGVSVAASKYGPVPKAPPRPAPKSPPKPQRPTPPGPEVVELVQNDQGTWEEAR